MSFSDERYEQRMAEIEQAARDRRDGFAKAALIGLLAAPDTAEWDFETMASRCVLQADALIAALDKPREGT